jgi:hypothetical protein
LASANLIMNSMTTPTNATIGNSQVEKNESRTIGLIDEYARGFCMRHLSIGLVDFRSAHPFYKWRDGADGKNDYHPRRRGNVNRFILGAD